MDDTTNPTDKPYSKEPIGSPPGGGSWRWTGYDWERNADVPQTDPAARRPARGEAADPADQE